MASTRAQLVSAGLALLALSLAPAARAAGGSCELNGGATCQNAINSAANVVNDVFKDKNGKTYDQLPVTAVAKLFQNYPGCPYAPPYLPNWQYGATFQIVADKVNQIDGQWGVPVRWDETKPFSMDATTNCPVGTYDATESVPGGYLPQYGFIFDLGGPSNQVVIFPWYDHGPNPCESVEYTVYLSDNAFSKDKIDQPTTLGADPQKWNRAKLDKLYLQGKGPAPGASNDWVAVYSLPCGISFRYASLLAGNDGADFPECSYLSWDAELDGVMGLTESGEAVCPDADKDKYVDCKCPTAPAVCDCDDTNEKIHPGAPEPCDSPDVNCDNLPGSCDAPLVCYQSVCIKTCKTGEFSDCPPGATCQNTAQGSLCVANDCTTGGCPDGSVCDSTTKTCVPACDQVKCPYGQQCLDGKCVDSCKGVQCPSGQTCVFGECRPPCGCFNGDVGCQGGLVCDKGGTNECMPSACQGKPACPTGQHCNDQGNCVGLCDGVVCPTGEKCDEAQGGCIANCQGVTCNPGETCDPQTGQCAGLCLTPCILPKVCIAGQCVFKDGGSGGSSGGGGVGADGGIRPNTGTDQAGDDGGCGCRAVGLDTRGSAAILAWLALTLGLARRRRSR